MTTRVSIYIWLNYSCSRNSEFLEQERPRSHSWNYRHYVSQCPVSALDWLPNFSRKTWHKLTRGEGSFTCQVNRCELSWDRTTIACVGIEVYYHYNTSSVPTTGLHLTGDWTTWKSPVKSCCKNIRGPIHIHLTTQNFNFTLWMGGWLKIESPWRYGQITCLCLSNKKTIRKIASPATISQKSSFVSYHCPYLAMLFSNFYHTLSILKGRAEGKGENTQTLKILYQVADYQCIFKVFYLWR